MKKPIECFKFSSNENFNRLKIVHSGEYEIPGYALVRFSCPYKSYQIDIFGNGDYRLNYVSNDELDAEQIFLGICMMSDLDPEKLIIFGFEKV